MIKNESGIKLETKLVGAIEGKFYVPSYQRGYRWGKEEVLRLLDDIYSNGMNSYCLQPVVVRKTDDYYELIDGQQRLTTLFILLQYIQKEFKPKINIKYAISYETRINSAEYLKNIDEESSERNIDFYHIYQAFQTIDAWFEEQDDPVVAADDLYGYLVKYVRIIWYEVGESEDAIALFTRLNIGKIPLTSAELVKAMFLSQSGNAAMTRGKQEEISLQWDNIERELHNDSLWYFLTNSVKSAYQTRIDLILDLISEKAPDSKEKYFTFFYFDAQRNSDKDLNEIWKSIQHTFLILKDWYENHELYHKIGYLIASGKKVALQDIYDLSKGKKKSELIDALDDLIRDEISLKNSHKSNYADLSYENNDDYDKISKLLLLFNVESVRQIDGQTQRFPFNQYKFQGAGKVAWSLEHIHAQNSEGMRKQEQWKQWLKLHVPSVIAVKGDDTLLLEEMQTAINKDGLERQEFERLEEQVISLLSAEGSTEYLHSIANLALLNTADNAALSNSTFDVKRNEIVEMDKNGQYIPYCTKMAFLKYYTPSTDNQLHFWGQPDRIAYVESINKVLEKYLDEPIFLEKEGD